MHDERFAREKLFANFENIPDITFDGSEDHALFTMVHPELSRPKPVSETGFRELDLSPVSSTLAALQQSLRLASAKYEYGRTSGHDWNRYLRFSGDRLRRVQRGSYRITSSDHVKPTTVADGGVINATREVAQNWFHKILVPSFLNPGKEARHFVLGDRGSGKSTLLKYLITMNWSELVKKRVIFSRFEFMKFVTSWNGGAGEEKTKERLDEYVSYILLRDYMLFSSYTLVDGNKWVRHDVGDFSGKPQIQATLNAAKARFHGWQSGTLSMVQLVDLFHAAASPDKLEARLLQRVPLEVRIALLSLCQEKYQIALVLDGLDHVAMEDSVFRTERKRILDYLGKNINAVTSFGANDGQQVRIRTHIVVVMRENTPFLSNEPNLCDVEVHRKSRHRVGKIDTRVAIYNLLQRSMDIDAGVQSKDAAVQRRVQLLMRAIDIVMGLVSRSVRAQRRPRLVFDIFCGDLRSIFRFVERLFAWAVIEGIQQGLFVESRQGTIDSLLSEMTGPIAFENLNKKKYRVIEVLLLGGAPWFENAIRIDRKDEFAEAIGLNLGQGTWHENERHWGFIDNIFNYHDVADFDGVRRPQFLTKLFVLRLVEKTELSSDQLRLQLSTKAKIELSGVELYQMLIKLLRTQMIAARISDGKVLFSATAKGEFVANYLFCNMVYLEHVFHQALFPTVMVRNISDWRRDAGVSEWVARSIRNSFVLLAYVKFVEARSVKLADRLRVFETCRVQVLATLHRILSEGSEDADLGRKAIRLIDNTLSNWERSGILSARKVRSASRQK